MVPPRATWLPGSNARVTLAQMIMAATSPPLPGLHKVMVATMDMVVATGPLVLLRGSNLLHPVDSPATDMARILATHPRLRRWVLQAHRRALGCLLHRQACLRHTMALVVLRLPRRARGLLLR